MYFAFASRPDTRNFICGNICLRGEKREKMQIIIKKIRALKIVHCSLMIMKYSKVQVNSFDNIVLIMVSLARTILNYEWNANKTVSSTNDKIIFRGNKISGWQSFIVMNRTHFVYHGRMYCGIKQAFRHKRKDVQIIQKMSTWMMWCIHFTLHKIICYFSLFNFAYAFVKSVSLSVGMCVPIWKCVFVNHCIKSRSISTRDQI